MKYLITVLPLICMAVQSNGMHADPVEWRESCKRYLFSYDSAGNMIEFINHQEFSVGDSIVMIYRYRYLYSYDNKGNKIETYRHDWNIEGQDWDEKTKSVHFYNEAGFLTENMYYSWEFQTSTWDV